MWYGETYNYFYHGYQKKTQFFEHSKKSTKKLK
jgi:hypothetical protein